MINLLTTIAIMEVFLVLINFMSSFFNGDNIKKLINNALTFILIAIVYGMIINHINVIAMIIFTIATIFFAFVDFLSTLSIFVHE